MTSYSRYSAFEALTRKHGVVCVPPDDVSVEDLVIATGNIVGTDKVRAASRMNKREVIFVSETELVHEIVSTGLSTGLSTDDGHFVLVSPLDTPAVKFMISNAPPFLKNQTLISELSRYGYCGFSDHHVTFTEPGRSDEARDVFSLVHSQRNTGQIHLYIILFIHKGTRDRHIFI